MPRLLLPPKWPLKLRWKPLAGQSLQPDAAQPVAPKIVVRLAAAPQRQSARWRLSKPTVVGPSVTFSPVKTRLAPSTTTPRQSRWKLRAPPKPNLVQSHYRFRNDDGTEVTATWRQAVDTPDAVPINTLFRLRVAVTETMGGQPNITQSWLLQWRQNGGAWNPLGAEDGGAVVQAAGTWNIANLANTTQQITAGSFTPGATFTASGAIGQNLFPLNSLEDEWTIRIGHQGGANPGDTFDFRVIKGGVPINQYNVTPTVTVSALVAVSPPLKTKLSPSSTLARTPHPKLRPPRFDVAPPVPFFAAPIRVRLVGSPGQARTPHYKLRQPTVLSPVYTATPVRVSLVPMSSRSTLVSLQRAPHWELRPPTIVTPFVPPTPEPPPFNTGLFVDRRGNRIERWTLFTGGKR